MGAGTHVYLASAELASVCSVLGRIPDHSAYMNYMGQLAEVADETYRYLNFNEMPAYTDV